MLRLALILTGILSGAVFAQNEAGQLSGKVTDPNRAAVAGATVTVKSLDTGIERDATTSTEGFFLVTSLQPGLYELTVNAAGFAPRTQRVRVTVGSERRVDTELSVTPVTGEQNVVEGSGGVDVNDRNFQLADPISGRQIRELPTITRDPYDLVSLSSNLTPLNNVATTRGQRDPAYAINGQRPTVNNVQLDGGENIVNYTTSLGQRIPLEGVQEIQVITNGYRPEFGRAGGGIVNVATRQGSNDFNGAVYWFHRNRALSTNSFENNAFGIPKGQLVANQFGVAVGGPIIRDRLFFFNNTEGNLVRSREDRIALVPTASLLAASAPATQAFFGAFPTVAPINGRVLTVGQVLALTGTPAAGNAFAALPSTLPALGQVFFNVPTDIGAGAPQDSISTVTRLDYTLSDKSLIYGRYSFEDRDFYVGSFGFSPFAGFNSGSRERNHDAMLNWTKGLFTAWTLNLKGNFNRINLARNFNNGIFTPSLFLTGFQGANVGGFQTAFPGDLPFDPTLNSLLTGPLNLTQVSADMAGPLFNQQFRFGGSYFYWQDNRRENSFRNGQLILGPSIPAALSNLVLGQASTFITPFNSLGAGPGGTLPLPLTTPSFERKISAHDFSLYFSHNWRVLPRLNVNWGLRYDFFDTPGIRNRGTLTNFLLGNGPDIYTQVSNGRVLPVNSGVGPNGESRDRTVFNRDWNNVAPRIGIAWDITGDGRTSLRGGYGITYERLFYPVSTFLQGAPNFALASFTAGAGAGSIPLSTNPFGPLGGTTGTVPFPTTLVRGIESNIDTPMIHNWSVSLEREITRNTVGAIQYAGAAGRDLFTVSNVNRPGTAAALLGASDPLARLNPLYGPIYFLSSDGRSNYNALLLELTNSSWERIGLQFTARYRYAKALDNVPTFLGSGFGAIGGSLATGSLSPFNPNFDYGPSDYDIRHRFIGSFNWEVPINRIGDRFFGTGGISRQVFGGWALAGIFNVQSGTPFTVFNCNAAFTAETPCPRATVSGGFNRNGRDTDLPDPLVPNRYAFLESGNFVTTGVPAGTALPGFSAGTLGRNFFRNPNFWNIDVGVHKRFAFTENTSIQFRGEFFNVFNHANLFVPSAVDIGSTGFVPASKFGRRQIQLAVKLLF